LLLAEPSKRIMKIASFAKIEVVLPESFYYQQNN